MKREVVLCALSGVFATGVLAETACDRYKLPGTCQVIPGSVTATVLSTPPKRLSPFPGNDTPRVELTYQVCNLQRDRALYFRWVAAGLRTSSDGDIPYGYCGRVTRQGPTAEGKPVAGAKIEFTRSGMGLDQVTYRLEPEFKQRLFDLLTELNVAPLDLAVMPVEPAYAVKIENLRKEPHEGVSTRVQFPASTILLIALPKMSDKEEAEILKQIRGREYSVAQVVILTAEQAVERANLPDAERGGAREDLGSRRVLYVNIPNRKSSGFSYYRQTDDDVPIELAFIAFDTVKKTVWSLRYNTVTKSGP